MYNFIIQAIDSELFAACDERCVYNLITGVVGFLFVAGLWKIFEKAEKKELVPAYLSII